MRLVDSEEKLEAALAVAQREAKAAFGDDTVYLEKAIVRPRHIEIQVFGDEHGGAGHLYERDCSIQLRNQKVVEIAPAPGLETGLSTPLGQAGKSIASEPSPRVLTVSTPLRVANRIGLPTPSSSRQCAEARVA